MDSDHIHPPLPPSQLFLLVLHVILPTPYPHLSLLITLSPISPVHMSMGVSPAAGVWKPPSSHILKGGLPSLPPSLLTPSLPLQPSTADCPSA